MYAAAEALPFEALSFEDGARCLAELGHAQRLRIFRLLVMAGERGMPVGAIQAELGIPKSTLAHHLAQLVATGLMTQVREGRVQRCRLNGARAKALLSFLVHDCCEGLPDIAGPAAKDLARIAS